MSYLTTPEYFRKLPPLLENPRFRVVSPTGKRRGFASLQDAKERAYELSTEEPGWFRIEEQWVSDTRKYTMLGRYEGGRWGEGARR